MDGGGEVGVVDIDALSSNACRGAARCIAIFTQLLPAQRSF